MTFTIDIDLQSPRGITIRRSDIVIARLSTAEFILLMSNSRLQRILQTRDGKTIYLKRERRLIIQDTEFRKGSTYRHLRNRNVRECISVDADGTAILRPKRVRNMSDVESSARPYDWELL